MTRSSKSSLVTRTPLRVIRFIVLGFLSVIDFRWYGADGKEKKREGTEESIRSDHQSVGSSLYRVLPPDTLGLQARSGQPMKLSCEVSSALRARKRASLKMALNM